MRNSVFVMRSSVCVLTLAGCDGTAHRPPDLHLLRASAALPPYRHRPTVTTTAAAAAAAAADGHRSSADRASALQTVIQLMGERNLYEYWADNYKTHSMDWTLGTAKAILDAWQLKFTQVSAFFGEILGRFGQVFCRDEHDGGSSVTSSGRGPRMWESCCRVMNDKHIFNGKWYTVVVDTVDSWVRHKVSIRGCMNERCSISLSWIT